jgi:hypothetical protein
MAKLLDKGLCQREFVVGYMIHFTLPRSDKTIGSVAFRDFHYTET